MFESRLRVELEGIDRLSTVSRCQIGTHEANNVLFRTKNLSGWVPSLLSILHCRSSWSGSIGRLRVFAGFWHL